MTIKKWLSKNTNSLAGKTVAISGATGGLGVVLCEYLVGLGADLILLNRSEQKTNDLISILKQKYPNSKQEFVKVDMQDFESVKSVTEVLKSKSIDVLLLNAGAYKIPRCKTDIGYDNVFQINFVSPYYMIRQLLPYLNKGARVVVVGSIAHNYSKINEQDIDFSLAKKPSKVYGNAKRFLMYSLAEYFKNNNLDAKLAICHPGITHTNITNHFSRFTNAIIKYPMKVIFEKPQKAALNILKGVFDETGYKEWIGPKIFNVWGMPKKQKLKTAKELEIQKISQISEKIYQKTAKN